MERPDPAQPVEAQAQEGGRELVKDSGTKAPTSEKKPPEQEQERLAKHTGNPPPRHENKKERGQQPPSGKTTPEKEQERLVKHTGNPPPRHENKKERRKQPPQETIAINTPQDVDEEERREQKEREAIAKRERERIALKELEEDRRAAERRLSELRKKRPGEAKTLVENPGGGSIWFTKDGNVISDHVLRIAVDGEITFADGTHLPITALESGAQAYFSKRSEKIRLLLADLNSGRTSRFLNGKNNERRIVAETPTTTETIWHPKGKKIVRGRIQRVYDDGLISLSSGSDLNWTELQAFQQFEIARCSDELYQLWRRLKSRPPRPLSEELDTVPTDMSSLKAEWIKVENNAELRELEKLEEEHLKTPDAKRDVYWYPYFGSLQARMFSEHAKMAARWAALAKCFPKLKEFRNEPASEQRLGIRVSDSVHKQWLALSIGCQVHAEIHEDFAAIAKHAAQAFTAKDTVTSRRDRERANALLEDAKQRLAMCIDVIDDHVAEAKRLLQRERRLRAARSSAIRTGNTIRTPLEVLVDSYKGVSLQAEISTDKTPATVTFNTTDGVSLSIDGAVQRSTDVAAVELGVEPKQRKLFVETKDGTVSYDLKAGRYSFLFPVERFRLGNQGLNVVLSLRADFDGSQ